MGLNGNCRLDPGRRRRAFRVDCARIWGNRYDYARTKYMDNHTPVEIVCARHGTFWLRPREHIQRRIGCPRCPPLGSLAKLASARHSPRQDTKPPLWGQHLLRSPDLAARVAAAALPDGESSTSIAEIGVGAGALTEALLCRSS